MTPRKSQERSTTLLYPPARRKTALALQLKIDNLKEGEKADVEGPYGSFTNENVEGPYTFIAGGIGITPLMSMIRTINDRNKSSQTQLIYGNRSFDEIVFREELEDLKGENNWLSVEHVLSNEDREGFRSGFIDKEVLEE
ncbi:MAG: ferredoxin--NADP reductase [Candidatus Nanohalobium sp.]